MHYTTHPKEKNYFIVMTALSLLMYVGLGYWLFSTQGMSGFMIIAVYAIYCALFRWMGATFFIGYLKGNALKVDEQQFPEVLQIVEAHCNALKMDAVPEVYVLQSHGVLNAFATRLARKNMVILYSDILEVAYQEGAPALSFIIGHELGHIQRGHVALYKTLLTFPASCIPFLSWAYSRAREYTCDKVGYALCPKGAAQGLLVLAAGKQLYKKVSVSHLLATKEQRYGFATLFAEAFSTHPALLKRIDALNLQDQDLLSQEDRCVATAHIKEAQNQKQV